MRSVALCVLVATIPTLALRDLGGAETSSVADVVQASRQVIDEPRKEVEKFLTGPDTEMFDSLAIATTVIPSQMAHEPGYTVKSLLLHPIPRFAYPEKPRQVDDVLNDALYPGYEQGRAGPAYSVLGGLYFDSGFIGVFVGMVIVGFALRRLWGFFLANRNALEAQLVFAAALPFTVVLCRGTFLDTASRALFVVGPLLALPYLSRFLSGAVRVK
jgi:hypothetical protein